MTITAAEFLKKHGMHPDSVDFDVCCEKFRSEMVRGLSGEPSSLMMIPTYVSPGAQVPQDVPAIVMDAGGTNFRIALCTFRNGQAFVEDSRTVPMPGTQGALQKEAFLNRLVDLMEPYLSRSDRFGFCFSFPAEITPDLDGILKGFNKEVVVRGTAGMAICKELCDTIVGRGYNPPVYALINDTVAALLGGYGTTDQSCCDGYIGFILGTGTNCCYTERTEAIRKLPAQAEPIMVINTESGGYAAFPMGDYDRQVDASSNIPGDHLYEKMVSGVYFGRIAGAAVAGARDEGLFSPGFSDEIPDALLMPNIGAFLAQPEDSLIYSLCKDPSDRETLTELLELLLDRAAKMVAVNLTAILDQADMGRTPERPACIVVEGSTFHKGSVYQSKIRSCMEHYAQEAHGRHYFFLSVEQANIMGSAVAALLKH